MECSRIKKKTVSVRQLAVTAFAGGLAPAAAGTAYGWQGIALAVPLILLAGGISVGLAPRWSSLEGRMPGYILKVCHGSFAVILMAKGFSRSAERLAHTGGGGVDAKVWLVVLLAVPLVWMSFGKIDAFFRTAEICYLAVLVVTAAVLVWAGFRIDWRYLLERPVSLAGGMLAAAESAGLFLFSIPYIYKEACAPGDGRRALEWLAALTAGAALLALATAGVLSPAVLPLVNEPFFTMAAALGRSIRVEGLVSALWIFPDVICLGFLSRSWHQRKKDKDWMPAVGIVLGAGCAALGVLDWLPGGVFGLGTVALWVISSVALAAGGKK